MKSSLVQTKRVFIIYRNLLLLTLSWKQIKTNKKVKPIKTHGTTLWIKREATLENKDWVRGSSTLH